MIDFHYLASANTYNGFKNNFDYINPDKDKFIYILKGGPGTGKSTLMKKIAEYFKNKNFCIEYFYCSSDISSLDGIRIVEKNVSIIDGTSPHTMDPQIPNVQEKIINLGEYILPSIKNHKKRLTTLINQKTNYYKTFYSYLSVAGKLFETEKMLGDKSFPSESEINNILLPLKLCQSSKNNVKRNLFLSYIGNNKINTLIQKNSFKNVINLDAKSYFYGSKLLENISKTLDKKNINYISFQSIFDPTLLEAIYIENDNTLILNNIFENNNFKNQKLFLLLTKTAGKNLEYARIKHRKIEKIYIKNMNFERLDNLIIRLKKEIESL